MKRILTLTTCLAAMLLAGKGLFAATDAARRPNVLFIAVDDLNTRIGCYGDPVAKTPNLDRLARSGIRFDRAYCQFPLCNPTRVSLLLGRYPTTTETIDFSRPALLEKDWVTLPQHFRQSGYEVQLLGKIFHYPEPKPWSAGEEAVRKEQEVHRRMIADLTRWEPYRTLAPPPTRWVEMLRTWANVFRPANEQIDAEAKTKDYEWPADVKNAGQAVQLLEQWARSDKPFFLGVGFYKPHVPLVAPQRFFDLYPPEKMPLPEDFAPTPTADNSVPRYALRYNLDLFYEERPTPEKARQAIAAYYACVSFVDDQLGRVLDALQRLGLRDNTVIVLWGDHGWHLGEKGMWAKGTLFDVSARVPLVIVDPRKKTAGRGCPRTVEFLDIYPTLVELCGLAMPPGLEGKTLAPLLEDPTAPWDKPAYTLVAREDWLGRSVRTERWCYTEWDYGRRGVELYDLRADPRESKNLAKNAKLGPVIAELKTLLHAGPVSKESPIRAAEPLIEPARPLPPKAATTAPAVGTPIKAPLWPGKAPVGNGAYETIASEVKVYLPPPDKATGAAVVICPGGGYIRHVVDREGYPIAEWLNAHGIAAVLLEYRLPEGRPYVPLLDAQRAIRLTRARASEWKIDPRHVGILGFSAGGHVASTAGTHFDAGRAGDADPVERLCCRPDFMLLVYPVVTMGDKTHALSKTKLLGANPKPELVQLFSNETQVTDQTPPAFLAHAKDDRGVPPDNSRNFVAALKAHHVPVEYLELPSGGHGLNGCKGPLWEQWKAKSLLWLVSRKFIPSSFP